MSEHAVFARTADGQVVRVTDSGDWPSIQRQWKKLDGYRRERRFPHVRFFEVRSMDDPGYAGIPVSSQHGEPLDKPRRGFRSFRVAAHTAFLEWQGTETRDGKQQGRGGWFYWHNGRTAAQGLYGLEALARARGLVIKGVDGRYYPLIREL